MIKDGLRYTKNALGRRTRITLKQFQNKSVEPINYPAGNSQAHLKRYTSKETNIEYRVYIESTTNKR